MRLPIALSLLALGLSAPALAAPPERPLSLQLSAPPGERSDFHLDVTGAYGTSPGTIIMRDAAFGGLIGGAAGGVLGLAADKDNWGRDLAIGAGVGLLLGVVVGVSDAQSTGGSISVHTSEADRPASEGTPAMSAQIVQLGRRF
jgi:hypothetical protein